MSSTILFDSDALQPIPSTGGGVYSTRKRRASIESHRSGSKTTYAIDEESVAEKDAPDERDVRRKQVCNLDNRGTTRSLMVS
jgi:hypothetical protein